MRRSLGWSALVLLGAFSARAQSGDFPSVVGGTTVAPREDVLEFGLGHSDAVSVGWRHGLSSAIELGVVGSGTFGYRGLLFMGGGYVSGSALGAKLQGRLKARLLQARGEYPAARAVAEAALDGGALPDWQWQLRTVAGRCAEEEGDLKAATASFTEATVVIDQLRRDEPTAALRTGLLTLRREPYEALFELAVRAGDTARALELMEQLLSRAFSEAMVAQKLEAPLDLTSASGVAARRLAALQTQASASASSSSYEYLRQLP